MKWDNRFLALAKHISFWSKDPSTQVGAVIVDPLKRVVSLGYNGFPRGVEDSSDRLNDRATKLDLIVHAELNAIFNNDSDLAGCMMYITASPCLSCAKAIIQSGICEVVLPNKNDDPLAKREDWQEEMRKAKGMLWEAGILTRRI